jgi:hypothetical protein
MSLKSQMKGQCLNDQQWARSVLNLLIQCTEKDIMCDILTKKGTF